MNQTQVESLIRQIALVICTALAQQGWLSGSAVALITPALVAVGVAVWGLWARSAEQQIAAVSKLDVVNTISVSDAELAGRLPDNVVTGC